jgi:RHS repeat-associated protein
VRQLADATGQVSLAQGWDPFGVPFERWGVNGRRSAFGYTGEWWDAEAELLYLRARYYQPDTGRFLTRDPWEGFRKQPQTLNKYVYITNAPPNKTDPSGLCSQVGWNDPTGLFTEENCNRLESGDLDFIKQWYYDFADYVEDDLPQTAMHFRHFLGGVGGELQLPNAFIRDDILGIGRLQKSIDHLIEWYIRKNIDELEPCVESRHSFNSLYPVQEQSTDFSHTQMN